MFSARLKRRTARSELKDDLIYKQIKKQLTSKVRSADGKCVLIGPGFYPGIAIVGERASELTESLGFEPSGAYSTV